MTAAATKKKISDLTHVQKMHLAWRLDAKTYFGYGTAGAWARGQHGDIELVDLFCRAGMSHHSAKIHARKVVSFKLPDGIEMPKSPFRSRVPA